MNYSDLNKTQKRLVDAFVALRPELADAPTITRPEVEELFFMLFAERANGGPKIGYPQWLVKGDKTSRGVYRFPAPNVKHENAPLPKPKTQKQLRAEITMTPSQVEAAQRQAEEDEDFFAELKNAGIEAVV